jgi:hypothetical protein
MASAEALAMEINARREIMVSIDGRTKVQPYTAPFWRLLLLLR